MTSNLSDSDCETCDAAPVKRPDVAAGAVSVTPEVIGGVVLVPLVIPELPPGVMIVLPDAVPLLVAELAPEVMVVLPVVVPPVRLLPEPEMGVVVVDGDVLVAPVPVVDDAEPDATLVRVLDIPVDVGDDVVDDSGVLEVFDRDADAVLVPVTVIVEAVVVVRVVWLARDVVIVELAVVDVSDGEEVEVLVVCVSETVVLVLVVVVVIPTVVESGRIGTLVVEVVLALLDDVVVPNDEQ